METPPSLLERLHHQGDQESWQRFHDLYKPMIVRMLQRDPKLRDEAEDLVQDILRAAVNKLSGFERKRHGSLSNWLRIITLNCVRTHMRKAERRLELAATENDESVLEQLSDPRSDLSLVWDRQYARHVIGRLLRQIEPDFKPKTIAAFRRWVLDGIQPAVIALELNMSVNAVVIARSRVTKALRRVGKDLID